MELFLTSVDEMKARSPLQKFGDVPAIRKRGTAPNIRYNLLDFVRFLKDVNVQECMVIIDAMADNNPEVLFAFSLPILIFFVQIPKTRITDFVEFKTLVLVFVCLGCTVSKTTSLFLLIFDLHRNSVVPTCGIS